MLEDQASPKRCGHFDGKKLIPLAEMVEKLVAATYARQDPDLVLVARTDAIASEGFDAALARARAYEAAGADVTFIEAAAHRRGDGRDSTRDGEAVPDRHGRRWFPLRSCPASELEQMGYRIALYANFALRIASRAVEYGLSVLHETGTSASLLEEMYTWEERQETVGFSQWEAFDASITDEGRRLVDAD